MPGASQGSLRILRHGEIDSTQLEARRVLHAAPAPLLPFAVVAREQAAGRGREARAWASPVGGVWVTGVWPLAGALEPLLGLRLGLAVLAAIWPAVPRADDSSPRLRLKWPNDVMLDGRKVAGILAETAASPGSGRVALVGVGVNANVRRCDLPPVLAGSAAILHEAVGREVDLDALLDRLLDRIGEAIQAVGPPAETVLRANERLYHRGEPVALLRGDGNAATGVLAGLDSRGEPILLDPDGARVPGRFIGYAPGAAGCSPAVPQG